MTCNLCDRQHLEELIKILVLKRELTKVFTETPLFSKWEVYRDNYFSNVRISVNLTLLLYLQDRKLFWRFVLRIHHVQGWLHECLHGN